MLQLSLRTILASLAVAVLALPTFVRAQEPKVTPGRVKPGDFSAGPADPQRLVAERAQGGTKPIYGNDDRMDWGTIRKQPNDVIRRRARASVALFLPEDLKPSAGGHLELKARTLGQARVLCEGERFAKQFTASFCSGTLVGEDLVLTAGHCIRESSSDSETPFAKDALFVFGYYAEEPSDPGNTKFETGQIYRGKEFVDGTVDSTGADWAVVRLERKVLTSVATPVKERRTAKIQNERSVYVVGYPSGLPIKYAPDAKVTKNTAGPFFTANLDTFAGNSGSGVFDQETGELVGVLVRGDTDYYKDGACQRAYKCPQTGCLGEEVMRIEQVKIP
jgi:V8-like Glu-specific endopeptidase